MLQQLQVKGWLDHRNLSARERKKVGGPACTCLPCNALYLYLFWCWSLTCTLLTDNACKHCPCSMGQMPTRTCALYYRSSASYQPH